VSHNPSVIADSLV